MGCEKVKGGFVSTMRASMERRRVSNANVTSLRQRKYPQEPTMQKDQEKLERAKEILERRKSQRDRLNACSSMHSHFGNPNAKHPDHLGGLRRPNTDGIMFERPQWTASLQNDYESLIKLREKEIAVATLRIENQKQLVLVPCKSIQPEEDTNPTNGSDEPYLLNGEFEFHQDALEQEYSDNHFNIYHKSNDAYLRNDMEDLDKLEHELFAYANETEKYHTNNIGRDLLLIEPTVFREHSFNGQRTGSLPPRPPSISKVVTLPLKSCLKSIKDCNQKPISPLNSETPKSFNTQASSERMSSETSQATDLVATLNMENRFLPPWDDHQVDQESYANDSFEVPFDLDCKECPDPQPVDDLGIPGLPFSMSTESLEKHVSATDPSDNAFSEPEILRPKLSRQMESSESAAVLSWSGIDTQFQETERGDLNSPNASDSVHDLVPPRYTSTSESWQEEIIALESSVPDECHTPRSLQRYEDKKWGAEEESFMITSLDSEAATTRLLAEVVAIQSRLEDWKLKPIDFEYIFEEPYYRHRFEQPCKNEMTPAEETRGVRIPPDDDYETFVNTHNEQGVIDMNIRNSEIVPMDTGDYIREPILDTEFRIAENASNAHVASSIDEKDVLTKDSSDQVDNFTEMPTFEEREKLHGAAWGIPWTSEGQQRRQEEPSADQGKDEQPANSTVESSPFTVTPSKPAGSSTIPVDLHSEKINQSRVLHNQQQRVKHVTVQTDNGLEKSGENIPRGHLRSPGISTQSRPVPQYCDRAESTANLSDHSLLSTERTSRYLNIGYRDLSEAPQIKHPKRSFYSSQGLLQVGYSQPRQSPQSVKQNAPPQNNKQAQASGFHDSLSDKENWCMSGPDDQELSILASLERLNWKLAAISARAKNRTNTTPSLVSQDQISIQSAPAATGGKGVFPDRMPGKFQVNQLRPSSVSTQELPTRSFRQRQIVGTVSNKGMQSQAFKVADDVTSLAKTDRKP